MCIVPGGIAWRRINICIIVGRVSGGKSYRHGLPPPHKGGEEFAGSILFPGLSTINLLSGDWDRALLQIPALAV